MNENIQGTPSPEVCASRIFEISGTKVGPDIAVETHLITDKSKS